MNGCLQSNNVKRELITKSCQYNKHVVIAGDFNYIYIDRENKFVTNEHRRLADYIDTLQECFLFQHVTEPTRHHVNEPSFLSPTFGTERSYLSEIHSTPLPNKK